MELWEEVYAYMGHNCSLPRSKCAAEVAEKVSTEAERESAAWVSALEEAVTHQSFWQASASAVAWSAEPQERQWSRRWLWLASARVVAVYHRWTWPASASEGAAWPRQLTWPVTASVAA